MYEARGRLGGHANTYTTADGIPIDTGFIVFNRSAYPHFSSFLDSLKVETVNTDMSFAYHCSLSGLQYGGHDLSTLFAQPSNCFHPDFLRMLVDMVRFNRLGNRLLAQDAVPPVGLGEFCQRYGFTRFFLRHYLIPLGAALWSASARGMLDFPAESYLRFFSKSRPPLGHRKARMGDDQGREPVLLGGLSKEVPRNDPTGRAS